MDFAAALKSIILLLQGLSGSNGQTITDTTPTVITATSTALAFANASRKWMLIQNNSAANIGISLSGKTLTGIVPTSTNFCIVLVPGAIYESKGFVSGTAITCYQTSGSTINTINFLEGQ